MKIIKITVNSDLPKLNEEINEAKRHWGIYSKHKKKFTDIVQWETKSQYRGKPLDVPCAFLFLWYIHGHDPDNVYFAQKYVFDGLVKGGLITEDKFKNTRGGTLHYPIKIPKDKKSKVVVFIFPEFSFFQYIKTLIHKFL